MTRKTFWKMSGDQGSSPKPDVTLGKEVSFLLWASVPKWQSDMFG